jgi:hypothetical protein
VSADIAVNAKRQTWSDFMFSFCGVSGFFFEFQDQNKSS